MIRSSIPRLLVLVLVLLPPAIGVAQSPAPTHGWEETNEAAKRAHQEGRHAAARELFLRALRQSEGLDAGDPRRVKSLNNLGLFYRSQGRPGVARGNDSLLQRRPKPYALQPIPGAELG